MIDYIANRSLPTIDCITITNKSLCLKFFKYFAIHLIISLESATNCNYPKLLKILNFMDLPTQN